MKRLEAARSALVLVDYQERLLPAIHRRDAVLEDALLLADVARELGVRVVGTEQNPRGLGSNAPALRERCDVTVSKMHFDACADGLLDQVGASDVVIAGCEAHVCLLQTALGLLEAGRQVFVVAPACGSRRPEDHALAMQRLRQAGAVLVSVEMAAFEWLRSCDHERFKGVLAMLKRRC